MFYHNINPVLLKLGPVEIRWYGLIFVIGFIITYLFLIYYAKKGKIKNLNKDDVADFMIVAVIGVIVGSRLFEVLFYEPSYYFQNLLEIFMVWKGGLSFHGGLAGLLVGAYFFCKKRKIKLLQMADYTIIPAAIALCLGRFANFINGELYGIETTVPWAVKFKDAEGFRHPTQIYESFKNLLIFFIVFLTEKKKKLKDGTLFFLFLLLYGTIRFSIEFLKDFPKILIGLNMGQLLSLIMIIAGAVWFLRKID